MDLTVLGGDAPGRTLAAAAAAADHRVRLYDDDANAAVDALEAVERRLGPAALDRVDATTGLEAAVDGADLVVETTGRAPEALRERLAAVETHADRLAVLAVRTGASVTAAAAGLRHPDRAVGLRYRDFESPVEVVAADQTTADALDRAERAVRELGATPLVVQDAPSGVVSRLALAAEVEAMRLVDEGVAGVAAVDAAADATVGPLERADRAGLAGRLSALEELADRVGPRFAPPAVLCERVAQGVTGRDAGEGFYVWGEDGPEEPALAAPTPERGGADLDDPRA